MKCKAIISSLLLVLLCTSFIFQTDKTFTLTVDVNKLRSSKGIVQFALYNTDGSIPDENYKKCYKLLKAKITNGTSTITFTDIPIGIYAVNILHDENNNGKIDKRIFLPIEGIGFSNYKTIGLSNKPTFKKASFNLNSNKNILIKVIYL